MPKTRFNFVSESSDGIGFAVRVKAEGNPVRCWIRTSDAKSVGDNLVEKVGDVDDLIEDANPQNDVFIFDASGNGVIADFLVSRGFPVLGGSTFADRLERDREFGAKVMQESGVDVPKTVSFTDFEKARDFVREHAESRWVYKPSKQLGDLSPSHVSYDAEDLIEMLTNIEADVDIADPQFELQEFEKGIAFSTELWFDHGNLIEPLTNHTLERKELMNEDIGPSGGCLGNIVWMCEGCAVCDVAKRLAPLLQRNRFHGMCDLNVIVAKSGIYGLEFTPRFGYDASPTLFWELVNGDLAQFFADAARSQLRKIDTRSGFAGGVRVTIPPWPSEKFHAEENVPIRGLGKGWQDSTYLFNVKADDAGELCSAGAWGILMLFTSYGSTIGASLSKPLQMARDVRVKNKQFRTDLSECFKKDFAEIESLVGVI